MVPLKKKHTSKRLTSKNLSLGSEIVKMTLSPLIRVTEPLYVGSHGQNTWSPVGTVRREGLSSDTEAVHLGQEQWFGPGGRSGSTSDK